MNDHILKNMAKILLGKVYFKDLFKKILCYEKLYTERSKYSEKNS